MCVFIYLTYCKLSRYRIRQRVLYPICDIRRNLTKKLNQGIFAPNDEDFLELYKMISLFIHYYDEVDKHILSKPVKTIVESIESIEREDVKLLSQKMSELPESLREEWKQFNSCLVKALLINSMTLKFVFSVNFYLARILTEGFFLRLYRSLKSFTISLLRVNQYTYRGFEIIKAFEKNGTVQI